MLMIKMHRLTPLANFQMVDGLVSLAHGKTWNTQRYRRLKVQTLHMGAWRNICGASDFHCRLSRFRNARWGIPKSAKLLPVLVRLDPRDKSGKLFSFLSGFPDRLAIHQPLAFDLR
jgi:hypothetical protein